MTHFVLGLVLALPGQHCGSSYVAARAYSYAPSYSYGYAQTYAAPAYKAQSYIQSYYTPYVKQVQLVAVEKPAYDYSLQLAGDYVRQEQKAADTADLARQLATLTAELKALRAVPPPQPQPVVSQTVPVQPPQYLSTPSPQQAPVLPSKAVPFKDSPSSQFSAPLPPAVNPVPGAAPAPPPVGGETAARAVSLLQAKCAKCHTGEAPKGGNFRMFDEGGNFVAGPLDLVLMDHMVASQEMPPGRPLDDGEYAVLKAFVTEQKDAIAAAIKGHRGGSGGVSQD